MDSDDGAVDSEAMPWRIHVPAVVTPERVHHHVHLLLWQVRGTGSYTLDGSPWDMTPGHALWIPAGVRHQLNVHVNSVALRMFFDVSETATTLHDTLLLVVDNDLRTLLLAYSQRDSSLLQEELNLSRQILSLIEEQPLLATAIPMPAHDPALTVAENLRFNPGDGRTVQELAASAHTSVRTLERAFPAETGMTLRQWRIANRMEVAGLLLRIESNITAIASRVGYTNASAFGRVFKGHFGMTPSEYITRYGGRR
ncbi:MAG: AraC family transcriptional regulator [Microbacteriaceae bacterium]